MERFILQTSTKPNQWVCTDQENGLVCKFEQGKFNDTQQFTMLDEGKVPPAQLASILREMGDWLSENHYNLLF